MGAGPKRTSCCGKPLEVEDLFRPDCRSIGRSFVDIFAISIILTFSPPTSLFCSPCLTFSVVAMPALSPTMTSGTIGKWLVNVGDRIAPGDAMAEIETDKASMAFEAQDEFYIAKLVIEAGKEVNECFSVANYFCFWSIIIIVLYAGASRVTYNDNL